MDYGLGVDLGTTSTAAAIGRPGRVEIVGLGGRDILTPAVAFATPEATLLTGDAADRRARRDPDRAAREFKRRLGDPTPLLLGGAPYSPVRLLAAVLADTVAAVTRHVGAPPAHIVLTRRPCGGRTDSSSSTRSPAWPGWTPPGW